MFVARYWRIRNIKTNGLNLRLFAAFLVNITNVQQCAAATITSSYTPVTGVVTKLKTSATGSYCEFSLSDISKLDFYIKWDAGAGNTMNVFAVKFGANNSEGNFVRSYELEYSTDNKDWRPYFSTPQYKKIVYPGNNLFCAIANQWISFVAEPLNSYKDIIEGTVVPIDGELLEPPFSVGVFKLNKRFVKGKYFFEIIFSGTQGYFGFSRSSNLDSNYSNQEFTYLIDTSNGQKLENKNLINYFEPYDIDNTLSNTRIGIYLDMDNGTMGVISNNVDKGIAFSWLDIEENECLTFYVIKEYEDIDNPSENVIIYTGKDGFANTPPTGFDSLIFKLEHNYEFVYEIPNLSFSNTLIKSTEIPEYEQGNLKLNKHNIINSRDAYYGGKGFIKNTVKLNLTPNIPAKKLVMLQDIKSGIIIRETWSDPITGEYEFKFINEFNFYNIIAQDHLYQWQTTATGPVKPTLMPELLY